MGLMLDGNSAALLQHEAKEARDSALWESEAEGIAQDWADNVMEGGYAFRKKWDLIDFLDEIPPRDLALLIVNTKRDEIVQRQEDIRKVLADRIKSFFLEFCQDEIWDAIRSRDE